MTKRYGPNHPSSAHSRHPLCLLPSSPRRRGSRGRWPCPTDVIPAKAGIHYVIPNNGGKNRQPPALSLYRASNHSHCNNVLNGFDGGYHVVRRRRVHINNVIGNVAPALVDHIEHVDFLLG